MEQKINDGGAAFPVTPYDRSGQVVPTQCGMSLRDYFAAKAMQFFLNKNNWDGSFTKASEQSYKMADALLAERLKRAGKP